MQPHDFKNGSPEDGSLRAKNALTREKRMGAIYKAYLQGFSQYQIADKLGIDQSNVSRALAQMRKTNENWFKENNDPKVRFRSVFKEIVDHYRDLINEAYALLERTPKSDIKTSNSILGTIISLVDKQREALEIVTPSMAEQHFTEELEKLFAQIHEVQQGMKIHREDVRPLQKPV